MMFLSSLQFDEMIAAINIVNFFSAAAILFASINFATSDDHCYFDLKCKDCYPEYLPDVMTHQVIDNTIRVAHGEDAIFHCHRTKLKRYPDKSSLRATCQRGAFVIPDDSGAILYPHDLGCQTDFFEDVQHHVHGCNDSFQGRSYQYFNSIRDSTVHLAELCYDPTSGRTLFGRMTFARSNNILQDDHVDSYNKISMLESFMKITDDSSKFETEKVFADDVAMFNRMKSLMRMRRFNFADHTLVATQLLPIKYFYGQNGLVARFSSNAVPMWKNIVEGNLRHLHDDVVTSFFDARTNASNSIDVYVGTHGVLNLMTSDIYLKPGQKYPVPKYVYTLIHDRKSQRAAVLTLINNPFISISEIREAVFCTSMCNKLQWIDGLKTNSNYERTTYGIVFCCDVHSFSAIVHDAPDILASIPMGDRGFLKEVVVH